MRPFVCELYVRAITAGMNELERLKLKTEKASEARATEQTLSSWFTQLGGLLSASDRIRCECTLTAFSVHPSPAMYERIKAAPTLPNVVKEEVIVQGETSSEFGSWATDSRTQTNLVKTSETLNIKQTQHQTNVLSTAILTEGEALGLTPELCQDLAVLLSGPRVKTLSWAMNRDLLLENCRIYMERTHGGTRALTTELKYLNLDPSSYEHLPMEEEEDENDLYYGIEKGYEHLVEFQDQEELWNNSTLFDTETASSCGETDFELFRRKKKLKKQNKVVAVHEEKDPLSIVPEIKIEKKERLHSKEKLNKDKNKQEKKEKKRKSKSAEGFTPNKDNSLERPKDSEQETDSSLKDKKKERKPRKKKLKDDVTERNPVPAKPGSLSNLIGLKVVKMNTPQSLYMTNMETKQPTLESNNMPGSDPNVVFDGLFSMDDFKSSEKYDPLSEQRSTSQQDVNVKDTPAAFTTTKTPKPIHSHPNSNLITAKTNINSSNAGEEVRKSITKLLEYRRQRSLPDLTQKDFKAPTTSQKKLTKHNKLNAIVQPVFPEQTIISPKAVNVPEIPKVYINKKQTQQSNALKTESDSYVTPILSQRSVIKDTSIPKTITKPQIVHSDYSTLPTNYHKGLNHTQSASQSNHNVPLDLQNTSRQSNYNMPLDLQQTSRQSYHNAPLDLHQTLRQSNSNAPLDLQQTPAQSNPTEPLDLQQTPRESKHNTPIDLQQTPSQFSPNVPLESQQTPRELNDSPTQQNFEEFIIELTKSINAGTLLTKSMKLCASNKAVKKDSDVKSVSAHVSPVRYVKNQQRKKVEMQLDTFARRSYMHKNKQLGAIKTQDAIVGRMIEVPKSKKVPSDVKQTVFNSLLPQKVENTSILRNVIKTPENTFQSEQNVSNHARVGLPKQHIQQKISNASKTIHSSRPHDKVKTSVPRTYSRESSLSERDQIDILQILRQQNNLNKGSAATTFNTDQLTVKKAADISPYVKKNIVSKQINSGRVLNTCIKINTNPIQKYEAGQIVTATGMPSQTSAKVAKPKPPKISKAPTVLNFVPEKVNVSQSQLVTPPKAQTNMKVNTVKVRSKKNKSSQEWTKVMDALLAQKTPTRGINALDALKKGNYSDLCNQSLNSPFTMNSSNKEQQSRSVFNNQTTITPPENEGSIINMRPAGTNSTLISDISNNLFGIKIQRIKCSDSTTGTQSNNNPVYNVDSQTYPDGKLDCFNPPIKITDFTAKKPTPNLQAFDAKIQTTTQTALNKKQNVLCYVPNIEQTAHTNKTFTLASNQVLPQDRIQLLNLSQNTEQPDFVKKFNVQNLSQSPSKLSHVKTGKNIYVGESVINTQITGVTNKQGDYPIYCRMPTKEFDAKTAQALNLHHHHKKSFSKETNRNTIPFIPQCQERLATAKNSLLNKQVLYLEQVSTKNADDILRSINKLHSYEQQNNPNLIYDGCDQLEPNDGPEQPYSSTTKMNKPATKQSEILIDKHMLDPLQTQHINNSLDDKNKHLLLKQDYKKRVSCGQLNTVGNPQNIESKAEELIQSNDSFVTDVENSDYDILEELIDDELRQEIGELSSDECDTADAANNVKTSKAQNMFENNSMLNKNAKVKLNELSENYSQQKSYPSIMEPLNKLNTNKIKYTHNNSKPENLSASIRNIADNNKLLPKNCVVTPKMSNTNSTNNEQFTVNKNIQTRLNVEQQCLTSSSVINIENKRLPENCQKKADIPIISTISCHNQSRNIGTNHSIHQESSIVSAEPVNVVDPGNIIITSLSQPVVRNVLLINPEVVYDPYTDVCNVTQTPFITVNNSPAVTVYQTTKINAPVVNPIIIENTVHAPLSSEFSTLSATENDTSVVNMDNDLINVDAIKQLLSKSTKDNKVIQKNSLTAISNTLENDQTKVLSIHNNTMNTKRQSCQDMKKNPIKTNSTNSERAVDNCVSRKKTSTAALNKTLQGDHTNPLPKHVGTKCELAKTIPIESTTVINNTFYNNVMSKKSTTAFNTLRSSKIDQTKQFPKQHTYDTTFEEAKNIIPFKQNSTIVDNHVVPRKTTDINRTLESNETTQISKNIEAKCKESTNKIIPIDSKSTIAHNITSKKKYTTVINMSCDLTSENHIISNETETAVNKTSEKKVTTVVNKASGIENHVISKNTTAAHNILELNQTKQFPKQVEKRFKDVKKINSSNTNIYPTSTNIENHVVPTKNTTDINRTLQSDAIIQMSQHIETICRESKNNIIPVEKSTSRNKTSEKISTAFVNKACELMSENHVISKQTSTVINKVSEKNSTNFINKASEVTQNLIIPKESTIIINKASEKKCTTDVNKSSEIAIENLSIPKKTTTSAINKTETKSSKDTTTALNKISEINSTTVVNIVSELTTENHVPEKSTKAISRIPETKFKIHQFNKTSEFTTENVVPKETTTDINKTSETISTAAINKNTVLTKNYVIPKETLVINKTGETKLTTVVSRTSDLTTENHVIPKETTTAITRTLEVNQTKHFSDHFQACLEEKSMTGVNEVFEVTPDDPFMSNPSTNVINKTLKAEQTKQTSKYKHTTFFEDLSKSIPIKTKSAEESCNHVKQVKQKESMMSPDVFKNCERKVLSEVQEKLIIDKNKQETQKENESSDNQHRNINQTNKFVVIENEKTLKRVEVKRLAIINRQINHRSNMPPIVLSYSPISQNSHNKVVAQDNTNIVSSVSDENSIISERNKHTQNSKENSKEVKNRFTVLHSSNESITEAPAIFESNGKISERLRKRDTNKGEKESTLKNKLIKKSRKSKVPTKKINESVKLKSLPLKHKSNKNIINDTNSCDGDFHKTLMDFEEKLSASRISKYEDKLLEVSQDNIVSETHEAEKIQVTQNHHFQSETKLNPFKIPLMNSDDGTTLIPMKNIDINSNNPLHTSNIENIVEENPIVDNSDHAVENETSNKEVNVVEKRKDINECSDQSYKECVATTNETKKVLHKNDQIQSKEIDTTQHQNNSNCFDYNLLKDIIIDTIPLPNEDPNKRCVRVKLRNGKIFKATVFGQSNISIESLFSNECMKTLLMQNLQSTQRYTLNIKHVLKPTQNNTDKIVNMEIENINVGPSRLITKPIECVSLLSDDEDDSNIQSLKTEFGTYKVNTLKSADLLKHQNKLNQTCVVNLSKSNIQIQSQPSLTQPNLKPNQLSAISQTINDDIHQNNDMTMPCYSHSPSRQGDHLNAVTETHTNSLNTTEIFPNAIVSVNMDDLSSTVTQNQNLAKFKQNAENLVSIATMQSDEQGHDKTLFKAINSDVFQKEAILNTINDKSMFTEHKNDNILNNTNNNSNSNINTAFTSEIIEVDDSSNDSIDLLRDCPLILDQPVQDVEQTPVSDMMDGNQADKIIELKSLLLKDLGVADLVNDKFTTVDTLEVSNTDSVVSRTSPKITRKCVVELVKCDKLVKKYEYHKIMNQKCFVNLVRCDADLVNIANTEVRTPIKQSFSSDDYIDMGSENEMASCSDLSRSGSISLLIDFPFCIDETAENISSTYYKDDRSSPVIEIFETIAACNNYSRNDNDSICCFNGSILKFPHQCCSDWHNTKRQYHIASTIINNKCKLDCKTWNCYCNITTSKVVPSLKSLTANIFQNYSLLDRYNRIRKLTLDYSNINATMLKDIYHNYSDCNITKYEMNMESTIINDQFTSGCNRLSSSYNINNMLKDICQCYSDWNKTKRILYVESGIFNCQYNCCYNINETKREFDMGSKFVLDHSKSVPTNWSYNSNILESPVKYVPSLKSLTTKIFQDYSLINRYSQTDKLTPKRIFSNKVITIDRYLRLKRKLTNSHSANESSLRKKNCRTNLSNSRYDLIDNEKNCLPLNVTNSAVRETEYSMTNLDKKCGILEIPIELQKDLREENKWVSSEEFPIVPSEILNKSLQTKLDITIFPTQSRKVPIMKAQVSNYHAHDKLINEIDDCNMNVRKQNTKSDADIENTEEKNDNILLLIPNKRTSTMDNVDELSNTKENKKIKKIFNTCDTYPDDKITCTFTHVTTSPSYSTRTIKNSTQKIIEIATTSNSSSNDRENYDDHIEINSNESCDKEGNSTNVTSINYENNEQEQKNACCDIESGKNNTENNEDIINCHDFIEIEIGHDGKLVEPVDINIELDTHQELANSYSYDENITPFPGASINKDDIKETTCIELLDHTYEIGVKFRYNESNNVNECKEASFEDTDLLEDSCVNSSQKEVTLVYKDRSDMILKGIEYKDPVVGTCYVFPLTENLNLNRSNNNCLEKQDDVLDIDLKVNVPKFTYSKKVNVQLRAITRKRKLTDIHVIGKKYRKGKNIDYPKLTTNSTYSKEYKRVFDYCDSLKISLSQPYHKEVIHVENMLKNWPIISSFSDSAYNTDSQNNTLFYNAEEVQRPVHSSAFTLVEELRMASIDNSDQTLVQDHAEETNFKMGFGERSDRVIQNLKDIDDFSNVSAATLSDVKQSQPFLLSEAKYQSLFEDTAQNQLRNISRFVKCFRLRDKVRLFFEKTSVELQYDCIKKHDKDDIFDQQYNNSIFLYDHCDSDFIDPVPFESVVQVVQVGQSLVSTTAQNAVTCDPRVTQVSDVIPAQCSMENSPEDNQEVTIKTEYTELTTADMTNSFVQEYVQQNQKLALDSQNQSNAIASIENIPIETEINSVIKIEMEELPEVKKEEDCFESNDSEPVENQQVNNGTYSMALNNNEKHTTEENDVHYQANYPNPTEKPDATAKLPEPIVSNGIPEKTDQIAHAMNAAGITTTSESMANTNRTHALVNIISQKLTPENVSVAQTGNNSNNNNYSKSTAINTIALQQALAQILPTPIQSCGNSDNNQQINNTQITPQVLHIVQGKNSSGGQITLVDNNAHQSVINTPNATPVLHIVQNKAVSPGTNSNAAAAQSNSFSGISLVDAGLQQGGNQLLHIVNTGAQKNNNTTSQLLKRVNLLTNLANVQGSNEQKMVQFVCKSADGKTIQLNAPHQRGMVLRLQPIEPTNINVQTTPPKSAENHEVTSTIITANTNISKDCNASQQDMKSRSVYEDNYAKFIQDSKTPGNEKSTSLPKFNQAFGKSVFQEGNQKQNDLSNSNAHLGSVNNTPDNPDCQSTDSAMNLDHMGPMNSPPLLLRKSPAQQSTSTQAQANLVQHFKQSIAPMNIQTMHGGVIYTRQIPVIGGGQTINLITVPSTELCDDSSKQQLSGNQNEIEPSIIKIVPQNPSTTNNEPSTEDGTAIGGSNETTQNVQTQPVLTQMRIKLPMLSKTPQMVSGARVVRPSFFQIQRNVIGGSNQPVYQQLVLTAAPPLGQQTIRLPQTQSNRQIKVPTENQSSPESQMSSSTLEQLREFDMVLEQVKERSTTQPSGSNTPFSKLSTSSTDTKDDIATTTSTTSSDSTQQVLHSIRNNQQLNVTSVNKKSVTTPTASTVRSPDSSGIVESSSSCNHTKTSHTKNSDTSKSDPPPTPTQSKPSKSGSKSKSKSKSSNPPMKLNTVPPKSSSQKPLEDEQTTQRILYILAEYKEQVENCPDKNKPAPRRRTNPPLNPSCHSKRKKSTCSSRRHSCRDMSPIYGEETCRSEDSCCTSLGDCNESCLESYSPQQSPRKVARKLTFEQENPTPHPQPQPQRNVIVADGQTITVASRGNASKPATAVLMPTNYILPVSMVKSGQQIAIVTNRGPKLLTVSGGEGGTANALLLQRLIGTAGLKPVIARPGVRHVRLPTAALHNLQAFNLAATTTVPTPDSTAPIVTDPTPPELVDTRARDTNSPWTDRTSQVTKPESSNNAGSEPWQFETTVDPLDYSYEEIVRTENLERTVLVVHKKDGTSHRQHRFASVSSAALRHKYAILEHELRLQKSLSEECEDLGVDSPSASDLFPEAELLFSASPAHDHVQEQIHHPHTPQPTILSQGCVSQRDLDDQIPEHLLGRHPLADERGELYPGLDDVGGMITVSEDGQTTIALDHEEFARSHPNTTFHSEEPSEESDMQPYTIPGLKGRHITSTIFHAGRAPATVLMATPHTTVISQATAVANSSGETVKYTDIDNMIDSIPSGNGSNMHLGSVLVKDDGLTRFDSILNDSRELHLSNTAAAIVHSTGHATQVIRRVCYEDDKRDRFLMDEPEGLIAGDGRKMMTEDISRNIGFDSMAGDHDDDRSSPERHADLFWESNSTSERSDGRRPLDFSSDSDKCCKSPYEETNSTDSSGIGTHMRLDSVIKNARLERSGSADGSSTEDAHPPLRTYPPKRLYHPTDGEMERSLSGKTRAGERSPEYGPEMRRRASGRGVVKRGCHCCNGSPAPPKTKKSRQRKPLDFSTH
ncbi:hypothetical protein ACJJTC_007461 [Scirpophaga incertulas]